MVFEDNIIIRIKNDHLTPWNAEPSKFEHFFKMLLHPTFDLITHSRLLISGLPFGLNCAHNRTSELPASGYLQYLYLLFKINIDCQKTKMSYHFIILDPGIKVVKLVSI